MYVMGKGAQKIRNRYSGNTEGGGSFSEVSQEKLERLVYMRRAIARARTYTHTHTHTQNKLSDIN